MLTSSINKIKLKEHSYDLVQGISLEEIMTITNREDIVRQTDGNFTIVQDCNSRSSLEASWHIDGLNCELPPSLVILFCENAGRGDISTDLAMAEPAFKAVDPIHQSILLSLNSYYM